MRATQFFEFIGAIADSASDGRTVRLPHALFQPILSDDVAACMSDIAIQPPLNTTIDLAGPEAIPLDDMARRYLATVGDSRQVITDAKARYVGIDVDGHRLTPHPNPRLAATIVTQWLEGAQRKN